MPVATSLERPLHLARVDLARRHPQPSPASLVAATILSVGGSLAAGALLVWAGTSAFPSTRGYAHFRFSDYGLLTTIGVLIACAAWPVVTRISWDPRWLFFRLAAAATFVLWIPDLYLLARHEPARAVAVLMAMHLAIAIITYSVLVRVAPVRRLSVAGPDAVHVPMAGASSDRTPGPPGTTAGVGDLDHSTARLATWLAVLVGIEFAIGIAVLVSVSTDRPTAWVPARGQAVYLVHALLGFPIAIGAVVHLVRSRDSTRIARLSGWIGSTGVAVAGAGGLLAVAHPMRLVGLAGMLLGSVVAAFGYLLPALDRITDQAPPTGKGPEAEQAGI